MLHHHTNIPNFCFVFTGKEKDSLRLNPQSGGLCGARLTSPPDLFTRFYYFGARYYDPSISGLFLSVDPMVDKYPSVSPYAYCVWNPVKSVDPDVRDVWTVDEKRQTVLFNPSRRMFPPLRRICVVGRADATAPVRCRRGKWTLFLSKHIYKKRTFSRNKQKCCRKNNLSIKR